MAIITVTTGVDETTANGQTSLREALVLAAGSAGQDTIVFATGVSTIELSGRGPLVIASGNNVIIDGDRNNDGIADVTVDGNSQTSHFTVQSGAVAKLDGLILTAGAQQGSAGFNGPPGILGGSGSNGASGSPGGLGGTGEQGKFGGLGGNGGNAAGSILNLGDLTLSRVILTSSRSNSGDGGTGGIGGTGGTGGRGGDGTYGGSYAGGRGGDGGTGGTGGAGGNGGAAGTVFNGSSGVLRLVDTAFTGNYAGGGSGGSGGRGGAGGVGGSGGTGGNGSGSDGSTRIGNGGRGGDGGDGGNGGYGGSGGDVAGGILNQGSIAAGGSAAFNSNSVFSGSLGLGGRGGAGGSRGSGGGSGNYSGSGGIGGGSGYGGSIGFYGASDNNVLNDGGSGTITQVDSLIYINATDLVKNEGSSGTTTFTFHINRTGATSQGASVAWSLAGGAGINGSDFSGGVVPSGNVNFAAGGPNSIAVTFQVVGDRSFEGNENFTINLSNLVDPAGGITYGFGTSTVNGTIVTDDFVSRVYTNAAKTTVVSSQNTKADFLTALSSLAANQAIEVFDPSMVGDIGARTIGANNVTVFGNAPFDASFTLGAGVTTFSMSGTATVDVTGNNLANTINGNAGANILNGLAGADTMVGGLGNDKYFVDSQTDIVTEAAGGGTDQVIASASYTLRAGAAVETLSTTGGTNTISLVGNEFAQTIYGNNGVNVLNGVAGNDTLSALGGNDSLYGGLGNDRLIGGLGNDGFVFNTALNAATNLDTISDFSNASGNNDAIRLAKSIFTALTGNANTLLTKEQFVANAAGAATDLLQHIIYETDTGKLFYDADGNKAGGVAAVQFAQLGTTASHPGGITNADFFLI